jgi:GH24 family phage-related lysozyme (muramidase)
MAIISGSILAIGKALASGAAKSTLKKVATDKAKDFVKGKVKDKAKNLVKGRKKKKGGALAKQGEEQSAEIMPQQGMMGGAGALVKKEAPAKPETPKLEQVSSKIGYEKINSQINNLVNISSSIDDALKKQYQAELDTRKARKESNQKARRFNREALLEKAKGAAGILAGTIGAVGKKFNIFDFLKNILLGGLLLLVLKNIKKIIEAFEFLRDKTSIVYTLIKVTIKSFVKSIKNIFKLIKGGVKSIGKLIKGGIKNVLSPIGNLLKKAGSAIGDGLKKIGKAILNFAEELLGKLTKAATEVFESLGKPLLNFLETVAQKGAKVLKEASENLTKKLAQRAAQTGTQTAAEKAGQTAAKKGVETAAEKAAREAAQIAAVKELRKKAFKELVTSRAIQEGLEGAGLEKKIAQEMKEFAVRQSGLPDSAFKATSEEASELVTRELSEQAATNVKPKPKGFFGRIGQGLSDAGSKAKQFGSGLVDSAKSIGNAFMSFPGNVVNQAKEVGAGLKNLKDKTQKEALDTLQKKIVPTVKKVVEKNDLLKQFFDLIKNPGKAKDSAIEFVSSNFEKARKNKQLLSGVESLKKARKAGGGNLGPLDRILTVIETIIKYGLGESPINAIVTSLANLFGYAAGFAAASAVPVLGQSGIFNLLGGVAGSIIAEKLANEGLSLLLDAVPSLGTIEDPIANKLGDGRRPLLRDPKIPWDVYKEQWGQKKGVFFFGKEVFSNNEEKEGTNAKATEPTVKPQTPMMNSSSNSESGSDSGKLQGGEINFAKEMIKIHEGSNIVGGVHQAYKDSKGFPTIGYGHLIVSGDGYDMNSKISQSEADKLFDKDFQKHLVQAKAIPGYNKGNAQQKAALIDLAFNMGGSFYKDFPKFAAAVKSGDFQTAAVEIQDSDYYTQVGRRGPVIRDLLAGKGVSASYLKNIKVPTGDNLSNKQPSSKTTTDSNEGAPMQSENVSTNQDTASTPSQGQTSTDTSNQGSVSIPSQGQKSTGNIEKFAGYEDGTDEEIIVPMQDQGPIPIPVPSGGGSSAGSFSSSSGLLNSYYKKQLLGLLYKVG